MLRLLTAAFALCGLALAAPLKDAPAPLKQLCERICGVWDPDVPPVPDQFVTSYRFEWDETAGLIRGAYVTVGGVGGIHEEVRVFYGLYEANGQLWTIRAGGKARPSYAR